MRKRFRETLWFKKGLADAEAAREDAADDGDDNETTARNELLPVEDRYLEDGTLRPTDSQMFGLHTGTTQAIQPLDVMRMMNRGTAEPASTGVPERVLIAELKTGRRMIFAMLAGAALAIGSIVMTLV